jgi:hypothetical protein
MRGARGRNATGWRQQVYERMMRGQVAPPLRALGFTGRSRVSRMRGSGHYGEVRWQKDGRWTRRQLPRFTAKAAYWLGSPLRLARGHTPGH